MAVLYFGDFRLDTKMLTLEGPDGSVECRAMTLQLLLFLIERRNRFVGREELITSLWPGSKGGAGSLNQCISELRRSLGDMARTPTYIETRVKLGYRFIAPLYHRPTEKLEPLPPPPETLPGDPSPGWRRVPRLVLAGFGLVAVGVLAVLLIHAAGDGHSAIVSVAAPICEDDHALTATIAREVHEAVLGQLGLSDRLILASGEIVPADSNAAVIEVRCRLVHGTRAELSIVLRRSAHGVQLWGWTWVFPGDLPGRAGLTAEIADTIVQESAALLLR